jgi:hypothetical protein
MTPSLTACEGIPNSIIDETDGAQYCVTGTLGKGFRGIGCAALCNTSTLFHPVVLAISSSSFTFFFLVLLFFFSSTFYVCFSSFGVETPLPVFIGRARERKSTSPVCSGMDEDSCYG